MLKPRTKQRALGICLQMAGWSGAALLFYLVRFQGLESAAVLGWPAWRSRRSYAPRFSDLQSWLGLRAPVVVQTLSNARRLLFEGVDLLFQKAQIILDAWAARFRDSALAAF